MSTLKISAILFALGVALGGRVTGAEAQTSQSYCLSGAAGVLRGCGFASLEQCRTAGAGFGICSPSVAAPDPASANAALLSEPRVRKISGKR